MKPATLRKAKAFVLKWGVAFTLLMLGVWPALSLPAGTSMVWPVAGWAKCLPPIIACTHIHVNIHVYKYPHIHVHIQARPSPSSTSASGSGSVLSGASSAASSSPSSPSTSPAPPSPRSVRRTNAR